jgi:hypothetical protein
MILKPKNAIPVAKYKPGSEVETKKMTHFAAFLDRQGNFFFIILLQIATTIKKTL